MVLSLKGKHPGYFEAILQLRDCSPVVKTTAEEGIQNKGIPVIKMAEVTNGFDYYLADSRATKALGKLLQQQFGGQLLITASLFGVRKDKEVYRITVLFRELPFEKGNIVEYKGEQYLLKTINPDLLLQHQKSGKKVHVKYKEMGRVRKK